MRDSPIVQSLLDDDTYKFTMGQSVWKRHAKVPVKYALIVRSPEVKLAEVIGENELREELDHARIVRINNSELHYLRGTNEYSDRMFGEGYLEFFKNCSLPNYHLERVGGDYKLEFSGPWSESIYWEVHGLSIVNELRNRAIMRRMSRFERDLVEANGKLRLAEKIKILKQYPDLTFCDFGTRRRFGRDWQDYVISVLADEFRGKQFLGTSNVYFAMKYGLLPMGTSAHEMFMAYSGIYHGSDDEIRASHGRVLRDWWDDYGVGLSVALTDTYGSDFFFRDFTPEQARDWKGLRQDSGDPIEFGEKAIRFYKNCGVDPREKLIVFSDGLDVHSIVKIYLHFRGRIRTTFGWGTNLMNDTGIIRPFSMVIKLVEANGHGTVKLSDNLAKALGDPVDVERFKSIFGHTATMNEQCKY